MSLAIGSYLNNISNTSNKSSGINKNSAQYKAVEKDHLSAIIANEATMSEKERLIYETFGGRDAIIKNYMKLYDSNGNFLNAYGVAGMCVDGKNPSEYNQIINVSEDWRQYEKAYNKALYDAVKAANPNWKQGDPFDSSILDSVTRESVESNLVQSGNQFVRKSIDYSV